MGDNIMRKCPNCGADMKAGELYAGGLTAVHSVTVKNAYGTTKNSAVECYVCGECGKIELFAANPEKLK